MSATKNSKNSEAMTIYLSPELKAKVQAVADAEDRTVTSIVRRALEAYVAASEAKLPQPSGTLQYTTFDSLPVGAHFFWPTRRSSIPSQKLSANTQRICDVETSVSREFLKGEVLICVEEDTDEYPLKPEV